MINEGRRYGAIPNLTPSAFKDFVGKWHRVLIEKIKILCHFCCSC